jgi:hypothetical protein
MDNLPEHDTRLITGSITFAPDANARCYSAGEILAQAEATRLRIGLTDAILEVRRIKLWWDAAHPLMEYQVRTYPWEIK